MRKNMKLFILASALLLAACSQNENDPGAEPGGGIVLTPTVALSAGWNTGTNTRADQKVPVTLAPGGNIGVFIALVDAHGDPSLDNFQANYFEVTADGKLSRIPFSGVPDETEEPLNIPAPGVYFVGGGGEANLTTDGITYRSYLVDPNQVTKVTIGTDGKVSLPWIIISGGIRLNVKGTDGAAYTGADVTATLKTVSQYENKAFEVKTLTAAAPSVIWGDISNSSVAAGTQILELVVDGRTYKVNAPRQISFTEKGRLYTFNVRVGATGITVSSDDLSVGDFEVQASTGAEADILLYNGQTPNLLALDGCTPYWVAPVNAMTNVEWAAIDFDTVCPEGWHVPTKDEFSAMTGIVVEGTWSTMEPNDPNTEPIGTAFDGDFYSNDNYFWSSDGSNASDAWILWIYEGVGYHHILQSSETGSTSHSVRCVRKK